MIEKPRIIRDDFTEKYYAEENPHDKDLFVPGKASANIKRQINMNRLKLSGSQRIKQNSR